MLVYCYDRQPFLFPFSLEVPVFTMMTLALSMALVRTIRKMPWKIPGMVLFGIRFTKKKSHLDGGTNIVKSQDEGA